MRDPSVTHLSADGPSRIESGAADRPGRIRARGSRPIVVVAPRPRKRSRAAAIARWRRRLRDRGAKAAGRPAARTGLGIWLMLSLLSGIACSSSLPTLDEIRSLQAA
ncbi:MAG: hypothetical protein ACX98W_21365, partial [bacterium]